MSNNPPTKSLYQRWVSVKLLAEAEEAFTESAIRNYVFNAAPRKTSKGVIPGNGLAQHIRRVGSKVLINHGGFLDWIEGHAYPINGSPDEAILNIPLPRQQYPDLSAIATEDNEAALKKPTSKLERRTARISDPEPKQKASSRRQR